MSRAGVLRAWRTRTLHRAYRELATRRRGEFARLLLEIREDDPRPFPPARPGRKPHGWGGRLEDRPAETEA